MEQITRSAARGEAVRVGVDLAKRRLRHNAYCLELDGPSYRDPKVAPAAKNGLAKRIEKAHQKAAETTAK